MRGQRTRTKQLRTPFKQQRSGIRKVRSAISTHVRSIVDWIIIVHHISAYQPIQFTK